MVGDIPESVFAMFQLTFAIITPALIVGGFAERIRFSSILIFSILWSLVVYAPVTHWVWGGGWLSVMGLMDFAGGTVVHVNAGVAALAAALVVGRRKGFPESPMPPHNMTMALTGTGMLWVGWFGFNAGSAPAANGDAGMALLVTHISSAAAGVLTWMVCEWSRFGKPSALGAVTGMVAGLGTITSASGFVGPVGGLIIGIVAGVVCFNLTLYLKNKLRIDDSLDVLPVHGAGGALGTILVGLFGAATIGALSCQGLNLETIGSQLQVQVIVVVASAIYCAIVTFFILKVVNNLLGLRVTEDEETEGLDLNQHNERGYDL